jgi:hypothetical protein
MPHASLSSRLPIAIAPDIFSAPDISDVSDISFSAHAIFNPNCPASRSEHHRRVDKQPQPPSDRNNSVREAISQRALSVSDGSSAHRLRAVVPNVRPDISDISIAPDISAPDISIAPDISDISDKQPKPLSDERRGRLRAVVWAVRPFLPEKLPGPNCPARRSEHHPSRSDGSDGMRTVAASNRPTETSTFSRRITPSSHASDGKDEQPKPPTDQGRSKAGRRPVREEHRPNAVVLDRPRRRAVVICRQARDGSPGAVFIRAAFPPHGVCGLPRYPPWLGTLDPPFRSRSL